MFGHQRVIGIPNVRRTSIIIVAIKLLQIGLDCLDDSHVALGAAEHPHSIAAGGRNLESGGLAYAASPRFRGILVLCGQRTIHGDTPVIGSADMYSRIR